MAETLEVEEAAADETVTAADVTVTAAETLHVVEETSAYDVMLIQSNWY